MAQTRLGDLVVNTSGELPPVGATAPDFVLINAELKEIALKTFSGKRIILNIFPSVETRVCANSVREFNSRAASLEDTVVLCVSRDLPFALTRFCGSEGIKDVITLSDFRGKSFGKKYGVDLVDGPFAGLLARAVVVIDKDRSVIYSDLEPSIDREPDYEGVIACL